MARPGQRERGSAAPRGSSDASASPATSSRCSRRAVREVEAAVQRGRVTPAVRTQFQAVALLLREERARVLADGSGSDGRRAEQLKRLDGIATILATTAVRDAGLLALLADDAAVSDAARSLKREMLKAGGVEAPPDEAPRAGAAGRRPAAPERRVVPQSVISRQLANPFLAPDFSAVAETAGPPASAGRLGAARPAASARSSAPAAATRRCMDLPFPTSRFTPAGLELMPHQGQLVAAAAAGHRTFLLADEPGLGKTAQALLAAEAANAYPLLVVVPNVVKTNWAREAALLDTAPPGHRRPGQRGQGRRLRRHRRRQLRGARPPRRLARGLRVPRDGRRRGALHQEQGEPALPARPRALRAHPGPHRAARC